MWNALNTDNLGVFGDIVSGIARMESSMPGLFPDLRSASRLLVSSDYSGEHKGAPFQAYSFLIADHASTKEWATRRHLLRRDTPLKLRKMSYKKLVDKVRRRYLKPFLETADSMVGVVVTFLIDSRIDNVFSTCDAGLRQVAAEAGYSELGDNSIEKIARVFHLLSLLIAGLSGPKQHLTWVSDEDVFMSNSVQRKAASALLARMSGLYLTHSMGDLLCGSTAGDTGDLQAEDITAIPDLCAAAAAELAREGRTTGTRKEGTKTTIPLAADAPEKAITIGEWMARSDRSLRSVNIGIFPTDTPNEFMLSHHTFFRVSQGL